ncbi:hypothetical protein OSTOST_11767 [Ostertagia ostertagi]
MQIHCNQPLLAVAFTGAPVIICGEGVMGIVLKHPFNGRIFASHREKDPECLQYVTKSCYLIGDATASSEFSWFSVAGPTITEREDKYTISPASYALAGESIERNFVATPVRNNSMLPKCHYSLRLNALDGPRIQSAVIGELVIAAVQIFTILFTRTNN